MSTIIRAQREAQSRHPGNARRKKKKREKKQETRTTDDYRATDPLVDHRSIRRTARQFGGSQMETSAVAKAITWADRVNHQDHQPTHPCPATRQRRRIPAQHNTMSGH